MYDPTVGEAIKDWSRDHRVSQAVFLSVDRVDDIRESPQSLGLGAEDVDLLVCSDAEEILGIGDWGVDGVDISYVKNVAELFPKAILHFEDFGPENARRILDEYRIFNDDMQGTGAIVVASVLSGMKVTRQGFADQRLVVFGAGTAGSGMADQLSAGMVRDGLSEEEAKKRVWLIDKQGLITDDMPDLPN